MAFANFILDIAALLLWLNWLAIHSEPLAKKPSITLTGTLRKADPRGASRWTFLAVLALLLLIRAIVYWQISAPLRWAPRLDLGIINLFFHVDPTWRVDYLVRIMTFSVLSFAIILGAFYSWLLLLSAVNTSVPDTDPVQKLVRLHLESIEKSPAVIKLLLPFVVATILWVAIHPLLAQLAIVRPTHSIGQLFEQAVIIGLASYLLWKYLLVGILLLHLLNSYVYLGNHPLWNFSNATARNLLHPLHWLPLRIGKVDFLPVVVIALIFLITESCRHIPDFLARYHRFLPF